MNKFLRGKSLNKIAIVIIIIVCALLAVVFHQYNKEQTEYGEWAESMNHEEAESRWKQESIDEEKREKDTFYQKLADGFQVNILIAGDGIGAGEGVKEEECWKTLLVNDLHETYGSDIYTNNLSMVGNTSYGSYVQINKIDGKKEYDLAIICCGEEDKDEDFSLHYESLIRTIRSKYPKCMIISVLESSQKDYTDKIKTIQSLAEHYDIVVADMIKPFQKNYEKYIIEDIYPNTEGQKLYFETLKKLIDKNVKAGTEYKVAEISPVNKDVSKYDEFKWYDNNSFTRVDATTGTITIKDKGVLGIECNVRGDKGKIEIYVDGELYKSQEGPEDPDYFEKHIMQVSDDCNVKKKIKIVFEDKKQANSFEGICFSK